MFRMLSHLRRRQLIRLISFCAAFAVIAAASFAVTSWQAHTYKDKVEHTYTRALSELSNYINSIKITLEKGIYSNDPVQLSYISAKLWRESTGAKMSLASLPSGQQSLENTYKFISQVGDYAIALSKKAAEQGSITQDEMKNFSDLSNYANGLMDNINDMTNMVMAGSFRMGEIKNALQTNADEEHENNFGFSKWEEGFEGYPTLIYDGPFSDQTQQKEPTLTQGKAEISQQEAQNRAATLLGVDPAVLRYTGNDSGLMPSYCFEGENISAAVTINGGYVAYANKNVQVGDYTISPDDARARAKEFLKAQGIEPMQDLYYQINDGVCEINFAYLQGDVVCYPDQIKVGIALDTGNVVDFNAKTYISNHHPRDLGGSKITPSAAQAKVSPALTVQSWRKAVIPTEGTKEVLCYEFTCTGKNNEIVLVYLNVNTGQEENILIVLISGDGQLTK